MVNGIRVALICAAFSLAAAGLQKGYAPTVSVPIENEYVKVTVAPQSYDGPGSLTSCLNGDIPFVLLYFPPRSTGLSGESNPGRVSVRYIDAGAMYGCSAVSDGTYVQVDLKSVPAKPTFNDNAIESDIPHNDVVFENSRTRVMRVHFAPGEFGPIVDAPTRVILARTDSQSGVTFADGHREARSVKAGEVSFEKVGRQAIRNTGTTPLENIVVELKSKDSEKK
jgi:hypothetical protein